MQRKKMNSVVELVKTTFEQYDSRRGKYADKNTLLLQAETLRRESNEKDRSGSFCLSFQRSCE